MSNDKRPRTNYVGIPKEKSIARLLTVIAMLILSACAKPLTVKDFQESSYTYHLRANEQVLFFDIWIGSPPGYIVATDERVFYWDTYRSSRCRDSLGRFTSIDYVDIESIGKVFPLFLWYQVRLRDGRKTAICTVGEVIKIIQAHLEEINEIREELRAAKERTISSEELDKTVKAELKKRRTIQRALTD